MEIGERVGVSRPLPDAAATSSVIGLPGDAELGARIAAGEEAALAEAFDRHAHLVYGSVTRLLHDREAAEEVVQDVYLAVWRNSGQYNWRAGSLLS